MRFGRRQGEPFPAKKWSRLPESVQPDIVVMVAGSGQCKTRTYDIYLVRVAI
jgi:hypothetical protein